MALPPSASLVILSWSCNILVCLVAGGVGGRRSLLALGGVHPVRHLAEDGGVIHVPLYTLFVILLTKQNKTGGVKMALGPMVSSPEARPAMDSNRPACLCRCCLHNARCGSRPRLAVSLHCP